MVAAELGAAHIQISTHDLAPLKQVATGWVDYTFGYPFELLWNSREQAQDWAFAYFPVAGEAIYRLAYFGCSRGPLSEQLILIFREKPRRSGQGGIADGAAVPLAGTG